MKPFVAILSHLGPNMGYNAWPIVRKSVCIYNNALHIVYDLSTQNLNFVAPIPEQVGTTTMHFSEVSGGTYQNFPQ